MFDLVEDGEILGRDLVPEVLLDLHDELHGIETVEAVVAQLGLHGQAVSVCRSVIALDHLEHIILDAVALVQDQVVDRHDLAIDVLKLVRLFVTKRFRLSFHELSEDRVVSSDAGRG